MRHLDRPDGRDVSREREPQGTGSQVPYLYSPVGAASHKPVIAGVYIDTADPSQMPADNSVQLPGGVPDRLGINKNNSLFICLLTDIYVNTADI